MKYPEVIAAALVTALTLLFLGVTQVRTHPATGEGAGEMPVVSPVDGQAGAGQQSQNLQGSDQPISSDSKEPAAEAAGSGASATEGTNSPTGTPATTQSAAGLEGDSASGAAAGEPAGEGNEASGMASSDATGGETDSSTATPSDTMTQ